MCDSGAAGRVSAERDEALGDVGERPRSRCAPVEELPRAGQVAAAFAEIGERVPEPEVMFGRALHAVAAALEQQRSPRAAGPRSASDPASTMRPSVTSAADGDAADSSSHNDSTREYLRLRSGAVHQHRMLIDRAGEIGEVPELLAPRPGTAPRR